MKRWRYQHSFETGQRPEARGEKQEKNTQGAKLISSKLSSIQGLSGCFWFEGDEAQKERARSGFGNEKFHYRYQIPRFATFVKFQTNHRREGWDYLDWVHGNLPS
ncbi:uncharacterized protein LOC144224802 [Crocuta crocuta]